jgi:2',3'-cyclic-nucleotide 2'-phosphodiesterase (5'-nucleotidase family)
MLRIKIDSMEKLRIIYQNDVHRQWEPMARGITAFRQLSASAPGDVFRFNPGDTNLGTDPRHWNCGLGLLNRQQLHAATLGNHEFQLKPEHLINGLKQYAQFPLLVSNLRLATTSLFQRLIQANRLKTDPILLKGKDGQQYGVIGVTSPTEGMTLKRGYQEDGVSLERFEETLHTVQQQVNQLERQGVNRILLLSHLGLERDQVVAKRVKGIDIIVGGDSHDALNGVIPGKNWFQSDRFHPTLILQAGAYGQYVGQADVSFKPDGSLLAAKNQLLPTQQFEPDPEAMSFLKRHLPPDRPLTTLKTPYSPEKIHTHPDALAQQAADWVRKDTGADVALVWSSLIRNPLPAGPVTEHQLEKAMPYTDPFWVVTVSGQDLTQAISRVVGRSQSEPRLFHPSGLRYQIANGKVTGVEVLKKGQYHPIQPNETLKVAISSFLVTEKNVLSQYQARHDTGKPLSEFVVERTEDQPEWTLPKPDDRVRFGAGPITAAGVQFTRHQAQS